jgi:hypothetical protein
MSSQAAERLKEVVGTLLPTLKSAGFKRRGTTFNRPSGDGLVHVVAFSTRTRGAGPAGEFTIRVGAAPTGDAAWVAESSCTSRRTIGELEDPPVDRWWSLDDVELAGWAAFHSLTLYGLPWLDGLQRRDEGAAVPSA